MFGRRYFRGSYYGARYFGDGGSDTPAAPERKQPAAGGIKRGKKRWWQVEDKVYFGTKEQAERLIQAVLREEELPELKSKPAPKNQPKPANLAKVEVPDLPVWEFDWRPMYVNSVLMRDVEMANAIISAIRNRMAEDEDEEEVILLLYA